MWTFRNVTNLWASEDALRRQLRAARRQLRAKTESLERTAAAYVTREMRDTEELQQRNVMIADRDARIEELETTIRLLEHEIKGLAQIIERDRQRVEAETAIQVARAEAAAKRRQGDRGEHRGFIP